MASPAVESEPVIWSERDAGVAGAVERMVREHARLVYRVAFAVLRHPQDAEDATQEVFLRVHRSRHKLARVEDERAWLARIAWRVAVDKAAGRRPAEPLGDDLGAVVALQAQGATAEELARGAQLGRILTSLIASLPEELRHTLVLSTVEELTSPQVAEVLQVPEGTVRTRLKRARALLREKLGQAIGGPHA
jgi:RNA polymerase sigma-70 factor (ECF subfamily)